MREIKFRAWDKVSCEYVSIETIDYEYFETVPAIFDGDKYKGVGEKQRIDLEQFTGLKDKNGKEIYEGDILRGRDRIKYKCESCGNTKIHTEICKVIWSDYDYNLDRPNNRGAWYCEDKEHNNYELYDTFAYDIIGNIHENPELLK